MTKDEAMKMALEWMETIVNSNWRNWGELASPEEFERWVKIRANHSAVVLRQALDQSPDATKMMGLIPSEWPGLDEPPNSTTDVVEAEPVYAFRRKGLDDFCTCDKRRYDELAGKPDLFEVAIFYTAPPKPCVNRGLMEALKQIADETYDEWTNGAKAQRIAEAAIKAALKEKNHD